MKRIKVNVTKKLTILIAFIGVCNSQNDEVCDASMRNEECDLDLSLELIATHIQEKNCEKAFCEYSSLEDKEKHLESIAKKSYDGKSRYLESILPCYDKFTPSERATVYSKLVDELLEKNGIDSMGTFAVAYKIKQVMDSENLPDAEKSKLSDTYNKLPALFRDIADGPVCIITHRYDNEKVISGPEISTNRHNRDLESMESFKTILELNEDCTVFSIKGVERDQYWDAAVYDKVRDDKRRPIYTKSISDTSMQFDKYQWLLKPFNNGTEMFIQNKFLYEYAYAVDGGDYNDKLRAVFLWRQLVYDVTTDSQCYWKVQKC